MHAETSWYFTNTEARKYAGYTEKTLSVNDYGDNRKFSYDS